MQGLDQLPEDVLHVAVPIDAAFQVTHPELPLAVCVVPLLRVD